MDAPAAPAADGAPAPLPTFPCPSCGESIVEAEPEGDWMCAACDTVHFAEPTPLFPRRRPPSPSPAP